MPAIALEVDVIPSLTLAVRYGGLRTVQRITLTHTGEESLRHLTLTVSADPAFAPPWSCTLDALPADTPVTLSDVPLVPSHSFLAQLTERTEGSLRVRLTQGEDCIAEHTARLALLPANHWPGAATAPELVAAFSLPNHPALTSLQESARAWLARHGSSTSFDGYQANSTQRTATLTQAAWHAVCDAQIRYAVAPPHFEQTGQRVRLADAVLEGRVGNCLDLTLLFTALLESMGLNPFIYVTNGHAFPGVWLTAYNLPAPSRDHPSAVRKRVALGEALTFEATLACQGADFATACEATRQALADDDDFRFVVDQRAAREAGVHPLPFGERAPGVTDAPIEVPEAHPLHQAPVAAPAPRTRVDRWKQRLLDLTLNNRLLHLRDTKRTIPLRCPDVGALEDALATGATFGLAPRPEGADPEAPLNDPVWEAAARLSERNKRVLTALPPAELDRRATELYRAARTALEETGSANVYLCIGFLRWRDRNSPDVLRRAPLLLMPVRFTRGSARDPIRFSLADDEPRLNTTLIERLRTDGVALPDLRDLPEDHAGIDVPRVLAWFQHALLEVDDMEIEPSAALAELSFRKFVMWMDLEARTEALLANPVVRAIFSDEGVQDERASVLQPEDLDDAHPAEDDLIVVEADSSQLAAIHAASSGASFVLQGPPGTGKSQTITNLIAMCLARGRTVLFVAEKVAALEVVQNRLEEVGLGPFVLEAHSGKASRAEIYRQLGEALDLVGHRSAASWETHAGRVQALRTQLRDPIRALHTPGPWGESIHDALTRLIELRDAPVVTGITAPDSQSAHEQSATALRALVAAARLHDPHTSPWRGTRFRDWTTSRAQAVDHAVQHLAQALRTRDEAAALAAEALQLPAPTTRRGHQQLIQTLHVLQGLPPIEADWLGPRWREAQARVDGWLDAIARAQALSHAVDARWHPGLLQLDLAPAQQRYARWADAFVLLAWFFLFFTSRQLQPHARAALPEPPAVRDDLQQAIELQHLRRGLDAEGPDARRLLGELWKACRTDVAAVRQRLDRLGTVRRTLSDLCELDLEHGPTRRAHLERLLGRGPDAFGDDRPVGQRLARYLSATDRYAAAEQAVDKLLAPRPLLDLPELAERIPEWRGNIGALRDASVVSEALDQAEAAGLGPIAAAVVDGQLRAGDATAAWHRAIRVAFVDEAVAAHPDLRRFRGATFEDTIARFRDAEAHARALARDEVIARLSARLPDPSAPGEMATLRKERMKKMRHMPVRRLFTEIPNVLARLKPCVLMSPQSVAQYLDPALADFDLVVFDEASQIPPWDAIGAIARGRQAIVVGDTRQLPPTAFFTRGEGEFVDEDDEEELESILDECVRAGMAQRDLRWHFRSRHEALIAFSNQAYYDERLFIFPAAQRNDPELGLRLERVEGTFDRGRSRTNPAEAEAITAEVVRRLRDPALRDRSIGVVTFSQAQQQLIEDMLEDARAEDRDLDAVWASRPEPVFVKNLENVQGDERDVMLFSITYGPDPSGRITMNFGPLNRSGGERRLNVAITRARRLLIVYTSLDPTQIDTSRTGARGVHDLRDFLDFAARGALHSLRSVAPSVHGFPDAVAAALRGAGLTVATQVGIAGYRVDVAVEDPNRPGSYVAGIECDGPSYAQAPTIRDREQTRRAALERLNWTLIRVWALDWWHDPEGSLRRLTQRIDEARERAEREPAPAKAPDAPHPAPTREADPVLEAQIDAGTPPPLEAADPRRTFVPASLPRQGDADAFYQASHATLAEHLRRVVAQEQPIERARAYRVLLAAFDIQRLTSRPRAHLDRALDAAHQLHDHEGFLWTSRGDRDAWDGWRAGADDDRDVEQIAPEELRAAMHHTLRAAIGIDDDTLLRATASCFDARLSQRWRDHLTPVLDGLLAEGLAERDGERVRSV